VIKIMMTMMQEERDSIGGEGEEGERDAVSDNRGSARVQS